MWKVGLKGLLAHKRRLLGTCSAVLLGVAFLAGTLVLGDTMRGGFDDVFTEANSGVDAVVRSTVSLGDEQSSIQRRLVPADLAVQLAGIDGVAAAEPSVEGLGQIIAADGSPLGGQGPPTIAGNWLTDEDLSPWQIAEGRAPAAPGEVAIDKRSSDVGDLPVGSRTTVRMPEPVQVEVVGIATFGSADTLGGVNFVAFTLPQAQDLLFGGEDAATDILVRADDGVSQEELAARIAPILPDGVEVLTGDALTDEQTRAIEEDFLGIFENLLLVFTVIALLVASFSIYNTFSVILAQRTRESALLRAIGASRGQVLRSIGTEALVVGAISSAGGLVGGILLAWGLKSLMDVAGFGLPGGLVVGARSVITAVVVGMAVTLLAAVIPAVKASGVPPLAALRDISLDRAGTSRVRLALGALLAAAGIVLVLVAAFATGDDSSQALALVGLGAVVTLVGFVVLGPVVARPLSGLIGAPLPALRGVPGTLARENSMRNPKRTAATASALMVGVAVVCLFTVLGASMKTTIDSSVSDTFAGDLVIASNDFSGTGLSTQMAVDIAALPEVSHAAGIGPGVALVDGGERMLMVSDPQALAAVLQLGVQQGSVESMGPGDLAVSEDMAIEQGWGVGTTLPVTFADGTTTEMTVAAVYEGNELVAGAILMPTETWVDHAVQAFDRSILISLADGVSLEDGKAAVAAVAETYGAPEPQDRDEYITSIVGQVDILLNVVYVLLALSIIIALMGIRNTLALSVHERVRELGLLRAVGQTRAQLRSMIRWESVIIALFGIVGGLGLGLFLAWGLVRAVTAGSVAGTFFSIPVGQLLVVVVVGALAGMLAGRRPARRAARLDILEAISAE